MDQQERIDAMTQIMVKARKSDEDVGELIAASLQAAALRLGSSSLLVSGRPGSWEADIVLRMAQFGGHGVNREHADELAAFFVMMAEAKEDGGDILSQAMGEAVNALDGLDAFAGTSQWYADLINIGCQYSRYAYNSASAFNLLQWPEEEMSKRDE